MRKDFPEPMNETPRRIAVREKEKHYTEKHGKLYGHPSLEKGICDFWDQGKCTFKEKCKHHHLCRVCWQVDDHRTSKCPHLRNLKI